jgi:hypothetical protein
MDLRIKIKCKSFESNSMKNLANEIELFINKLNNDEILSSQITFHTTSLKNGNLFYCGYVVYHTVSEVENKL